MTQTTWVALLGVIAGGGLAGLAQALSAALPKQAPLIAGIVGVLVSMASFVLLVLERANSPAKAIVADAPVVNHDGTQVGVNVSTTSTEPISASQKG